MSREDWHQPDHEKTGNDQPEWDTIQIGKINTLIQTELFRRELIRDMCEGICLFLNVPKVVLEQILTTEEHMEPDPLDVNKERWLDRIKFLIEHKEKINAIFCNSKFRTTVRD